MKRTSSFISGLDNKPQAKPKASFDIDNPVIQRRIIPQAPQAPIEQSQLFIATFLETQKNEQLFYPSHQQISERIMSKKREKANIERKLKHLEKQMKFIKREPPSEISGEKQLINLQTTLENQHKKLKLEIQILE